MQYAARLSAVQELLALIEDAFVMSLKGVRERPADTIIAQYFRTRRYAGSGDRRFITGMLYDILRSRTLYDHLLGGDISARNLLITHCVFTQQSFDAFTGDNRFAPEAISGKEINLINKIKQVNKNSLSKTLTHNLPEWAVDGFRLRYGSSLTGAIESLNQQAPLTLRINRLKMKSGSVNLADFHQTQYAPDGITVDTHRRLTEHQAYQKGLIEVQDEAAQIASALTGSKPGMMVADVCAGAGGKALALAADMENKGQIFAFDVSKRRLSELKKRTKRAGARNIQTITLTQEQRSNILSPYKGKMDRVIVDVPCSGTGTWRRSPDLRFRMDASRVTALNELQAELLTEAALLVKPDGQLFYMTCSVLPCENEDIVDEFLLKYGGWQRISYQNLWATCDLKGTAPKSDAMNIYDLQLSPHSHKTDGFYIAALRRRQDG